MCTGRIRCVPPPDVQSPLQAVTASGDDQGARLFEATDIAPGSGFPDSFAVPSVNVAVDSTFFLALSDAVPATSHLSYTSLKPVLDHGSPPQETLASPPLDLEHWFVVVIANWLVVPLAIAARSFDARLE